MLAAALPIQDVTKEQKSEEQDMHDGNLEISLNEDELFEMLGQHIFSHNINISGKKADDLMASAVQYMKKTKLDQKVIFELDDIIRDIATAAGDHGFNMGFKEGVRLFRTLMKL